jgi:hypothetical protein
LRFKWKKVDDIWFTTSLIGHNQLRLIVNHLTFDFPTLKEKVLSNKIGQGVSITHMEEVFVPHKYKMEVMGHRDPISYGKSTPAFKKLVGARGRRPL